ncbi:large conductance mechanosensitive channel protein MscL [bacterium]|nr:MAG: large conductance mechanosensitive channel protein MscL [bacterium]
MKKHMNGFMDFIREQGVVGLAVGFILGAAVAKVVSSLVSDIVNPLVGLALGSADGLKAANVKLAGATITYGNFIATLLDFAIIALVVYLGVKILGLDRLDKKTDDKKDS